MPRKPERLDRRVVPESVVGFLRACQKAVPCHLGGGAALAGAYLHHRLTGDVDLFVHDREDMRELARTLPRIASDCGARLSVQRDAGHLIRCGLATSETNIEIDLVHEPVSDLESATEVEGIAIESLADLRANKLTCLLSRSEPRDLVDLYFLHRAGFPAEEDLELAIEKDAGIDPGVLAWLLSQFPTQPLPMMLEKLSEDELLRFRDDLSDRLRLRALGPSGS